MIVVQIAQLVDEASIDRNAIETLVTAICERFGVQDATVSVGVVGDEDISELSARFLNRKHSTDCLSFDLSDHDGAPRVFDLIVNGQMAERQAIERGHSTQAELALYVAHGLLHQLGFDDATDEQARRMHAAEDEILQHLGYGFVYNSHTRPRRQT
jgi:probable rRNA maturation factor